MTNEYAPAAIAAAFDRLDVARPDWSLQLSGILGDASHTYGFHRSRNWDARYSSRKPDYSIQRDLDRQGDGDAASALDIKPSGPNAVQVMATMTGNLIRAIDNRDPRARYLAEVYGTRNGTSVVGRLFGRPATSDSTHLWHLHIASGRKWSDDATAWNAIVDLILGKPYRPAPTDPEWSDHMTRDELVHLIREEIRDGLQAVEFGGDRGFWTEDTAPNLHTAPDNADRARLDRLTGHLGTLGQRVDALESKAAAE